LLAVPLVDRLIKGPPVSLANALALGQLGQQIADAMNRAVLPVRRRLAVLDRLDQAGGAVGHDQHRRAQPAVDQIAPQR
jgi:hypothetical protein